MRSRDLMWSVLAAALAAVACDERTVEVNPAVGPAFARGGEGRPVVLVNPNVNGNGTATTIQEGIEMVAAGGRVMVKPGTYAEALVINKGLTLEGIDEETGPVIISTPGAPDAVILVATRDPVTIRNLTLHRSGVNGILGSGPVNVDVERVTIVAVAVPPGTTRGIRLDNDGSAGPSRLVVRHSVLDGGAFPNSIAGISIAADVTTLIEGNVIVRSGGPCIFMFGRRPDGLHADIVNNSLDECLGRAGAIDVGPVATGALILGMTGVVNIVGNTIRNSGRSTLPATAIRYELYSGRIERNAIIGFVQPGTPPVDVRALPAAIWVGSIRGLGYTPASPVVRFNDIQGNAQAGLRMAPNITTPIDARCNWWGAASGPSGTGLAGTGDALVVETGASAPGLAPWATAPIAQPDGVASDRCHQDPVWSEPVNLGALVNSTANEFAATLDYDGLNLYFGSARAGGFGGVDIWTSHRVCLDCPWEAPTNLGPTINTSATDNGPSLSTDGRLLFFSSTRSGGQGDVDIYVSRRATPGDPWGPPTNLGAYVNSSTADMGQEYVENEDDGLSTMYFNRGVGLQADLYVVTLNRNGEPLAPAQLVPELSAPNANDAGVSLRSDQREILFFSTRPGTFGPADIWGSTRAAITDPWSLPENLGAPLNTRFSDNRPNLWRDRRTLLFDSDRPGGSGGSDIWISTRTQIP